MGTILIISLFYICWKVHKIDKKLNGSKGIIYKLADKFTSSSVAEVSEDIKS